MSRTLVIIGLAIAAPTSFDRGSGLGLGRLPVDTFI